MSNALAVQQQLQEVTSARSETARFVRMDGRMAVVNVGSATITVPCVGFYPPAVGMAVRVDWVNGLPAVTGPTQPLNPIGAITAIGTPRAMVTVDGVEYSLYYRDGYTPAVDDMVEVNWATGIIQGKITGVENPDKPEESVPAAAPFSVIVKASDSNRYDRSYGNWWGNDPWASNSNDGIWTYQNRVKDAVGSGTVEKAEIYLPLSQSVGNVSVGVHAHPNIPSGAPSLTSLNALPGNRRSGWQLLPGFGAYLAAGGRGVGVTAPGGGMTVWRGTASDSLSGALRLSGTR